MIIKINGKDEAIDRALNLLELVKAKGLSPEKIVLEYNFCIVPKEEWENTNLREKDNIEIVSFVGGG